jgi:hypothetical protein
VGSLIFVVIVATWAAYLLQHWIRRREDAAASDSVERFSEAMRVLQKRAPAPALATPDSPFVARRVTPTAHRTPAEVAPMSSSPAPGPHRADRADRRQPSPAPAPVVSRWRRQLRGVLLLLSLLWVPTSVVLAVLHILLWICVPLAVLTLAAVLVWLRLEVRADRARAERLRHESSGRPRKADREPQRPAPSPQGRRRARPLTSDDTQVIHAPVPAVEESAALTAVHPAAPAEPAPAMAAAVSGQPAARAEHPAQAERPVRREARSAAYDFAAELAREAAAHAPAPQPVEEGTWQPVPVPPPTYTMKAKAEPRMTPAGIPADVFATPEFAEEAEELDERGLFARRAANL